MNKPGFGGGEDCTGRGAGRKDDRPGKSINNVCIHSKICTNNVLFCSNNKYICKRSIRMLSNLDEVFIL